MQGRRTPRRAATAATYESACEAAGLTTTAYSFPYVAHWAGDADLVRHTATRVLDTARTIIEAWSPTLEPSAPDLPAARGGQTARRDEANHRGKSTPCPSTPVTGGGLGLAPSEAIVAEATTHQPDDPLPVPSHRRCCKGGTTSAPRLVGGACRSG